MDDNDFVLEEPYAGKMGFFITGEEYMRRLDIAIREFQRKVKSPFQKYRNRHNTGELQLIYQAVAGHYPGVVTRLGLARELYPDWEEIDNYSWGLMSYRLHSRLQMLRDRGLLEEAGRVVNPYYTNAEDRTSMSYRAIVQPDLPRFQKARVELYRVVDHLNEMYVRGAALNEVAVPATDREADMLALRTRGVSLAEIGRMYGVSRERVRQITCRAAYRGQQFIDRSKLIETDGR